MNIFQELFGPSPGKRVTKAEMDEIMNRLHDLDERERHDVEMLFRGDLEEEGMQSGISREEFDRAVTWLRENMSKHSLEENDIEKLERYFKEHLVD